ncbi:MAG: hypothetical protein L3J53_02270 [Proteobacteria bacterium]|nr:hypothetical protein [Pseudomonadota bacterium]
MKLFMYTILFIALLSTICYAEDKHKHDHAEPKSISGVESLSHDLRNLLSEEMKAIQSGMMSIIPAYISGNWSEIETIAEKIKNSYILKKSLTENQVKELHSKLPHGFIEKDQRFHYLAGMLAHAAKNKKPELINFYFAEMNESCVNCHSAFAIHKFPALATKIEDKHVH